MTSLDEGICQNAYGCVYAYVHVYEYVVYVYVYVYVHVYAYVYLYDCVSHNGSFCTLSHNDCSRAAISTLSALKLKQQSW